MYPHFKGGGGQFSLHTASIPTTVAQVILSFALANDFYIPLFNIQSPSIYFALMPFLVFLLVQGYPFSVLFGQLFISLRIFGSGNERSGQESITGRSIALG